MNLDLRLSTALHVLVHLPPDGAPLTSQILARCTQANAVVVRRTLAGLRDAGIVRAVKGHGGGWSLARDPSQVTLRDVQVALGAPAPFAMGSRRGAPGCLVEASVGHVLADALKAAEAALAQRLAAVTLADLTAEVAARAATRTRSPDMSSPPPGPTQSPEPSPLPSAFDAHARGYDLQLEPIRAFKDALHLLLQGAFANLPADAHVLVAGAGTGAEVRHLAPRFPTWRFTLVDPSAGMLDVARAHAEADGFAARCTFVVGRVSDLPRDVHHAAISVLVSHFLVDAEQRTAFFRDLADRLGPGGLLFTADLAADLQIPSYGPLMDLWLTLYVTPDRRETYRSMFGRGVAAHTPAEVEAMLVRAGFSPPTPCFQAALIRGWVTSRA